MRALSPVIEIAQLTPDQAHAYGPHVHTFLYDTWDAYYRHELGREVRLPAEPDEPPADSLILAQIQDITEASDLSRPGTNAYFVATASTSPDGEPPKARHGGIVGFLQLARINDRTLEIVELDVALDRRGERIGPGLLHNALGTLAVDSEDLVLLEALETNKPGCAFWRSLGFTETGNRYWCYDVFPNEVDTHIEMAAYKDTVQERAAARLKTS